MSSRPRCESVQCLTCVKTFKSRTRYTSWSFEDQSCRPGEFQTGVEWIAPTKPASPNLRCVQDCTAPMPRLANRYMLHRRMGGGPGWLSHSFHDIFTSPVGAFYRRDCRRKSFVAFHYATATTLSRFTRKPVSFSGEHGRVRSHSLGRVTADRRAYCRRQLLRS
jgi:hypothetical protein